MFTKKLVSKLMYTLTSSACLFELIFHFHFMSGSQQLVAVQVGQCGNQVGREIFSSLIEEAHSHPDTHYSLTKLINVI